MAYADFVSKIAEKMGITTEELLSKPKSFVLNTNNRGLKTVKILENAGFLLAGQRTVDIGCAYGGISIEAARQGSKVLGVDVVSSYLELAEANAKDDVDVQFSLCDATDGDFPNLVLDKLGGYATRVIIHDVLEHIYDTPKLLENVSRIMEKGGALYFVVPNGMATRFVIQEGHKKVYGISVMDPDCWHYFVPGRPRVFYRRWSYFRSLLNDFGFELVCDLTEPFSGTEVREYLTNESLKIEGAINSDTPSLEALKIRTEGIEKYLRELRRDIQELSSELLSHKYCSEFWKYIYVLK